MRLIWFWSQILINATKNEKIGIFFHSLLFLTLKYKFFSGTSQNPYQATISTFFYALKKVWANISSGWSWLSAPIAIIEKKLVIADFIDIQPPVVEEKKIQSRLHIWVISGKWRFGLLHWNEYRKSFDFVLESEMNCFLQDLSWVIGIWCSRKTDYLNTKNFPIETYYFFYSGKVIDWIITVKSYFWRKFSKKISIVYKIE